MSNRDHRISTNNTINNTQQEIQQQSEHCRFNNSSSNNNNISSKNNSVPPEPRYKRTPNANAISITNHYRTPRSYDTFDFCISPFTPHTSSPLAQIWPSDSPYSYTTTGTTTPISRKGAHLEGLFPNPAIKSPHRSRHSKASKLVSFQEEGRTQDQTQHCFQEEFPRKVTPSRPNRRVQVLEHQPPTPHSSSLPSPSSSYRKRQYHNMQDHLHSDRQHYEYKDNTMVIARADSDGVEVVLGPSSKHGPYSQIVKTESMKSREEEDQGKNESTPRGVKTSDKGKKVNVVSPAEGPNHVHGHGHNRSSSYNTADFPPGDLPLPSVPDSPYLGYSSSYHQSPHSSYTHQGYSSHYPTSPVKSPKSPKQRDYNNSPRYPSSYHQGAYAQEMEYSRDDVSPGKRQRVSAEGDLKKDRGAGYSEADASYRHQAEHYPQYTESRSGTSAYYSKVDSFDSEHHSGHQHPHQPHHPYHRREKYNAPPAVAKSSSYPGPPSPNRYEQAGPGDSSNASYPGARRSHARPHGSGSDFSYKGTAPPSHAHGYQEHGYYADSRQPHSRYHEMPSGGSGRHPPAGYYYHDGQHPPHPSEEAHPLLREYPDRDRRIPHPHETVSHDKHYSPDRGSVKTESQSVASTPSLKSRASKSSSPNKRKPSTAAKAAIAAGMTQPSSAREVDFDIHNPPMTPVTPPSKEPVCTITSNVNNNDVLCGRGGGTNTQIGNRRFRALVQDFQPTYLLSRRKEKPLIARTIVLIIRNRGGRFLKKDDGNGMLFEVGDEKAEAKTSQALREGLDVRASKSTTLMGRKKQKEATHKKKKGPHSDGTDKAEALGQGDDMTIEESPPRSQRDGPPESYPHYVPYPPYYYSNYVYSHPPPSYYQYDPNPAYSSPSRKRQRAPEPMYYPPAHPPYTGKYSYPPDYYQGYSNIPSQQPNEEVNPMWETDFQPPRALQLPKKEDMELGGEQ